VYDVEIFKPKYILPFTFYLLMWFLLKRKLQLIDLLYNRFQQERIRGLLLRMSTQSKKSEALVLYLLFWQLGFTKTLVDTLHLVVLYRQTYLE